MNEPIRIVAAIATDERGRLLLVRKSGTSAFMQPGGKVEPGEDLLEAIATNPSSTQTLIIFHCFCFSSSCSLRFSSVSQLMKYWRAALGSAGISGAVIVFMFKVRSVFVIFCFGVNIVAGKF